MSKHKSFGARLQRDVASTWTNCGQIDSVGDFAFEKGEIDVTTHDSTGGFREKLTHLIDHEDMDVVVLFDPADTHHQYFRDQAADVDAAAESFRILFSDGTTWEFSAFVKGFRVNSQTVDGRLEATIRLMPTGAPDFSPA